MQANPEKLQPEWEELAATSCAVQNLSLMGTALGVAGMSAFFTNNPLNGHEYMMHVSASLPSPQIGDGQLFMLLLHVGSLLGSLGSGALPELGAFSLGSHSPHLICNPLLISAAACAMCSYRS